MKGQIMKQYTTEKYGITAYSRHDYKYAVIAYNHRKQRNVAFYYASLDKAEKCKDGMISTAHWGLFDYVDLVSVELVAA